MKSGTRIINIRKASSLTFSLVMLLAIFATVPSAQAASEKIYTFDDDFDTGTLVGVEHETVDDQLQLSEKPVILPFIWVPNYGSTVSKINTETGAELGRYRVSPLDECSASRTTVDQQGNAWVGNRAAGTVVKIGLEEAGQYIDRNGNGVIDTSRDLNNDGDITGDEILDWGEDECVLYEVVLIPGKEGTFVPGTYMGGYDTSTWSTSPRGLAIDNNNNLWAGTSSTSTYYHINGSTGQIITADTLDVSPWGHQAYGATIDKNGILWSAMLGNHVLRIDTNNLSDIMTVNVSGTYGIGLDYSDHLFVGGSQLLNKIDIVDKVTPLLWTKSAKTVRGVVSTADNNIWVAGYDTNDAYEGVSRYDNDGNLITTIDGFNQPSGVAVDAAGKVWVTNIGDGFIHRIDPATNSIDLSKDIVGSGGHYTYSDMTGIVSRTITTKIGTWTVDFDSEVVDMSWGEVSWNSYEPSDTSVTVKVRSSNDQSSWSLWEDVTNGNSFSSTPDGQYLQIETKLQITTGDESPILYDLTVKVGNLPPVADAGPDQTVEQDSLGGASVTLDGSGSTDDGLMKPLTYFWTWAGGSAVGDKPTVSLPLGTTTVTLEVNDSQFLDSDTVDITVEDTTAPEVACLETVNPHGNNIPGEKNCKDTNEDGFYELSAVDICDVEPELYLMSIDLDATTDILGAFDLSAALGPYSSGYRVKYTEANGATEISEKKIGSDNDQADAIDSHVKGPHDLVVFAMDDDGNLGVMTCLVPPPPK